MRTFLGKHLLCILAHPDDESYLLAGTIYRNWQAGGVTSIICATHGEKGGTHLKTYCPPNALKKIRKRELLRVSRLLHVTQLFCLHFSDGSLTKQGPQCLAKVVRIAEKIMPEVIISFGPDGITGHKDHIMIGRIAKRIAKKMRIPFFVITLSPRIHRLARDFLVTRRRSSQYIPPHKIIYPQPTVSITINGRMKRRAIQLHASQLDARRALAGFPKFVVRALTTKEYFSEHP